MAELNPSDLPETAPAAAKRSVSRRRLVQAGAVALPVLMTMRVPALHGQSTGSSTASCRPNGSYDPTAPGCDDGVEGNELDGTSTQKLNRNALPQEGMSTFSEWTAPSP